MTRPAILFVIALMLAALTGCAGAAPSTEAPATSTTTPVATTTAIPTATPISPTETPTITPTPEPDRIVDAYGNVMIRIPAGPYTRGSEAGFPDEVPVHEVTISTFYIDRLETTNRQYQDCVEDGVCEPPKRYDCCTEEPGAYVAWPEYYGNPTFDDYPAIFVSWYDAYDYCEWRGARLATDAEWEKAARGTDQRTYPWGNDDPTPELLNFLWPEGDFDQRPLYTTAPVYNYEAGASPYGVLNMAGNVYEWLWDRYDPAYYEYTPYADPQGPDEGTFRSTRGGSFWNQAFRQRSANRNNAYIPANSFHFDGGIRCAASPPGPSIGWKDVQ